jgi:hypothetical protein
VGGASVPVTVEPEVVRSRSGALVAESVKQKRTRRGIIIRVFIYVVATHIWGAFLMLLFSLGD